MAQQYLALITVLSPAVPDNSLPMPQPPVDPGYSPGWARPRPPRPDQGLPGNQPYPDQGLPGNQPYPDQGLPGQPPRPWGPIHYPDQGLPGGQPYPDQGLPGGQGGRPSHPIYFPPEISGPNDPRPTPPIALPPDLPDNLPGGQGERPIEWKIGWTPQTGWIVVGVPQFPVATPS